MFPNPINVKLVNEGLSLSDWFALASLVISLISISLVLRDRHKKNKLEDMRLVISPKNIIGDHSHEVVYIYFTFVNESSLPISLNQLLISEHNSQVPDTDSGKKGGLSIFTKRDIYESIVETPIYNIGRPKIIDHKTKSLDLPITIGPFSSKGGYVGFHAGRQSALMIARGRDIELSILTSRGKFECSLSLVTTDFHEYSYDGQSERYKS